MVYNLFLELDIMNQNVCKESDTTEKICSKCKTGARFAYLDSVNTLCPWIRLLRDNKCKMYEPIEEKE